VTPHSRVGQKDSTVLKDATEEGIVTVGFQRCISRVRSEPMSRKRLRLIGCVALATYLLANSHASLLAGFLHRAHLDSAPLASAESSQPTSGRCCPHCTHRPEQDTTPSRNDSQVPRHDHEEEPCDPTCPGCPICPVNDSCPCPGGCALCSVTKAPCLDHQLIVAPIMVPTMWCSFEEPASFVSPICDGLIRPPRL
jgi:hypothetical protein